MQETWVRSPGQETPWRRKWQPTPVFLPEESHGRRSWRAAACGVTELLPVTKQQQHPLLSRPGKTRPGGPFCLYPAASRGASRVSSFSAAAGTPVMGLCTRTWTPVGWAAWAAECLCGTSSLRSLFITWTEGPVPYVLSPLSSTITLMWHHFSLLEHRDKKKEVLEPDSTCQSVANIYLKYWIKPVSCDIISGNLSL